MQMNTLVIGERVLGRFDSGRERTPGEVLKIEQTRIAPPACIALLPAQQRLHVDKPLLVDAPLE